MKKFLEEAIYWVFTAALCIATASCYLHMSKIWMIAVGYFATLAWSVFLTEKIISYVKK